MTILVFRHLWLCSHAHLFGFCHCTDAAMILLQEEHAPLLPNKRWVEKEGGADMTILQYLLNTEVSMLLSVCSILFKLYWTLNSWKMSTIVVKTLICWWFLRIICSFPVNKYCSLLRTSFSLPLIASLASLNKFRNDSLLLIYNFPQLKGKISLITNNIFWLTLALQIFHCHESVFCWLLC